MNTMSEDRERSASVEQAPGLDARFGVADEPQELGRAEVAAGRADDGEVVETGEAAEAGVPPVPSNPPGRTG